MSEPKEKKSATGRRSDKSPTRLNVPERSDGVIQLMFSDTGSITAYDEDGIPVPIPTQISNER
jgi:hypothetical protein